MNERTSRLQHEIKQQRPFRSQAQEAVVSMLLTTDLLRRDLSKVIEPHGITRQQYNVLRILRGAGEDGLPTLEIAARMLEQTPGITRLVDRLEGKRLVSRRRDRGDRRQITCRISRAGLDLLTQLDAVMDEADDTMLGLESDALTTLIDLLDRIRRKLRTRA